MNDSIITGLLLTALVTPITYFTALDLESSIVVAIVAILFINIVYWKVRGYSIQTVYLGDSA